jgi:SHS2 domain-containing protein
MFDIIAGPSPLEHTQTLTLKVPGGDWPDLMVNWLRELLYLWSGKELLVATIKIDSISEKEILATIGADEFDPDRHTIKTEIKAVTYHQIRVDYRRTGWQSRIIFDV